MLVTHGRNQHTSSLDTVLHVSFMYYLHNTSLCGPSRVCKVCCSLHGSLREASFLEASVRSDKRQLRTCRHASMFKEHSSRSASQQLGSVPPFWACSQLRWLRTSRVGPYPCVVESWDQCLGMRTPVRVLAWETSRLLTSIPIL